MRLLFLCSGLEPGRDGVGDYTRCLAQAACAAGHEVALVSVRDDFAKAIPALPAVPMAGQVAEWRLPRMLDDPVQSGLFRRWVESFTPDWVSVQHSAFGWHPRGLGARQANQLLQLLPATARRHLMLHELWLEKHRGQPFRQRVLGWLQHSVIRAWVGAGFRPHLTQVQCRWYQSQLADFGYKSEVWPLCSNFPVPSVPPAQNPDWLLQHLAQPLAPSLSKPIYWLGHFGSFYTEEWDPRAFLENFDRTVTASGKQLVAVAMGNMRMGREAWRALEERPPTGVVVASVRSLAPAEISVALSACDGAFCTTPWPMVEKSSAVCVWRALGVPVLTPRTKEDTSRAARLPAWPDAGLIFAPGPEIPLPPLRVPAPDFLDPAVSIKKLLAVFVTHDQANSGVPAYPRA